MWSFGMLSMEVFTDNVPFSHISNEAYIPLVLRDGSLPTRPETNISVRGLSDAMWNLMNQCWQRDPESRPSMSEIREAIQDMNLRTCTSYALSHQLFLMPRKPLGKLGPFRVTPVFVPRVCQCQGRQGKLA